MYVCMYVCMHLCVHGCVCLCMHVWCALCIHACICMRICVCMHVCARVRHGRSNCNGFLCAWLDRDGFGIYCWIGWLIDCWLVDYLLYWDARVARVVVWNCGPERPTSSALHCSDAGAPDRIEMRMRTRQSAVRFLPVIFAARLFFFVAGSAWKELVQIVITDPRGPSDVIKVCIGRVCGLCFFRAPSGGIIVSLVTKSGPDPLDMCSGSGCGFSVPAWWLPRGQTCMVTV